MDSIKVVDLEVYAYHGVLDHEKKDGQKFYVSFEAFMDLAPSAKTDDLNLSVSYADMCQTVKSFMTAGVYDLIETVAEGIARELLLTYDLIRRVKVELKKPSAPIGEPVAYPSINMERGWHQVYIGVGSNLGDSKKTIELAKQMLADHDQIRFRQAATLIETKPWGKTDQPDFVNGAWHIETLMAPGTLMTFLLETEKKLDRQRIEKWGPRTIDLDILIYDDLVTDDGHITVPHPLMTQRSFVMEPLCEIAPNLVHPLYRKRMFELK